MSDNLSESTPLNPKEQENLLKVMEKRGLEHLYFPVVNRLKTDPHKALIYPQEAVKNNSTDSSPYQLKVSIPINPQKEASITFNVGGDNDGRLQIIYQKPDTQLIEDVLILEKDSTLLISRFQKDQSGQKRPVFQASWPVANPEVREIKNEGQKILEDYLNNSSTKADSSFKTTVPLNVD